MVLGMSAWADTGTNVITLFLLTKWGWSVPVPLWWAMRHVLHLCWAVLQGRDCPSLFSLGSLAQLQDVVLCLDFGWLLRGEKSSI